MALRLKCKIQRFYHVALLLKCKIVDLRSSSESRNLGREIRDFQRFYHVALLLKCKCELCWAFSAV